MNNNDQTNTHDRLKFIVPGILLFFMMQLNFVFAQPPEALPNGLNEQQELRERNQQIARERQIKQAQKDVFLNKTEQKDPIKDLPEEEIAFTITNINLIGEKKEKFQWLQELLQNYEGKKIGRQGIQIIVKEASNALIAKGYVTTRITIPEQDISQGVLTLQLIPGLVEKITFADPNTKIRWDNALPIRPGDILNIRINGVRLELYEKLT